jgi:predicted RNA-binding protein
MQRTNILEEIISNWRDKLANTTNLIPIPAIMSATRLPMTIPMIVVIGIDFEDEDDELLEEGDGFANAPFVLTWSDDPLVVDAVTTAGFVGAKYPFSLQY